MNILCAGHISRRSLESVAENSCEEPAGIRKVISVRFLDLSVPVLVGLLASLRRPDAILSPQFWAEDAVIFFQQAREHGLGAFLIPHAGYFHLIPRVVAFVGNQFDLALAPAIYNIGWVAMLMLSARVIISARIDIPKFSKYLFALTLLCFS